MKNFVLRYLMAILLCVISATSYATPYQDLENLLNALHTLRANIVQVVYDERGKVVQTSYGQMALERPGKFRWEIKKPIPQLIIANGTRLWIYDPDLQQVTIRALHLAVGDAPALLLSHKETDLNTDFTVKELPKNEPTWQWFELIPKKADSMFASIEMGFMNGHIQEMGLKDHLGHRTKIEFKNPQINITLSASLFTFTPPKNADVIDETRQKN